MAQKKKKKTATKYHHKSSRARARVPEQEISISDWIGHSGRRKSWVGGVVTMLVGKIKPGTRKEEYE